MRMMYRGMTKIPGSICHPIRVRVRVRVRVRMYRGMTKIPGSICRQGDRLCRHKGEEQGGGGIRVMIRVRVGVGVRVTGGIRDGQGPHRFKEPGAGPQRSWRRSTSG